MVARNASQFLNAAAPTSAPIVDLRPRLPWPGRLPGRLGTAGLWLGSCWLLGPAKLAVVLLAGGLVAPWLMILDRERAATAARGLPAAGVAVTAAPPGWRDDATPAGLSRASLAAGMGLPEAQLFRARHAGSCTVHHDATGRIIRLEVAAPALPVSLPSPERILLAEDDARLAEPLRDFLTRQNHSVTWVEQGPPALVELLDQEYDLALLDWMLPGRDGLAIVTELRRKQRPTLVLMLTARDALEDVVKGLQAGADDYLVKPFRMAELAARIRSLERRAERPYGGGALCWGPLRLEVEAGRLSIDERELPLTNRELQLLEWFLRHPGRLASRALLLDRLWAVDAEAGEETVKTHLNNLRRKLRSSGAPDPIETVHGQGYRLLPPP